MDQLKKIEEMVLTCIETAKSMLEVYETVIPFGLRAYADSDDLKMNCPAEKNPDFNWQQQIEIVVEELKKAIKNENIISTVLVTTLTAGDDTGIGLQVETEMSSVLFVYPYYYENETWCVDSPIQAEHLLTSVYAQ